jgi:hypothetical protein
MTRMDKNQVYDELCNLLTDFEQMKETVCEEDLYDMLVKIQNNWEELTGEDE